MEQPLLLARGLEAGGLPLHLPALDHEVPGQATAGGDANREERVVWARDHARVTGEAVEEREPAGLPPRGRAVLLGLIARILRQPCRVGGQVGERRRVRDGVVGRARLDEMEMLGSVVGCN